MSETNWIEFEIWGGDIAIQGYMAEDESEDESPLNYYSWDGFECYGDLSRTKYPSFGDKQEWEWETITQWIRETDLVQYLVDFANESKMLKFRAEDDFGRIIDVELYINCSKLDGDSE